MAKVALETVGCRLNQYETERIAAELMRLGMQRVSYKDSADLYILNTCTVTGRADADCRNLINRAFRKNPAARIVVTGCYAVSEKEMLATMNGVDLVIGNEDKMHLPGLLRAKYPDLFNSPASGGPQPLPMAADFSPEQASSAAQPPHRPMVKIGDGCNQRCSYCIVPLVRGPLVSRPATEIVDEITHLVEAGYHEVVLTAVHIGRFLSDGLNLSGLVGMILDNTNLPRLRLSSLEPNELDDALLDLVAKNPRVCRHLHLPLQSGSDRILKLMIRPYTSGEYLDVIEKVKSSDKNITVGCDLIVGFPGETDDDFKQSLNILDSGRLDYSHVFSYSDRPGVKAADLPDKIDAKVIKERNRQARELSHRNRRRQMLSQIGATLGVISEHAPDRSGRYRATSDNYIKVSLPPGVGGDKEIVDFTPRELVDSGPSDIHLDGDVETR